MTIEELKRRLRSEGIVRLASAEWAALADDFEELERHPTHVAGDLVIVRTEVGPAAVEQPSRQEWVIRRLADGDEARRFVRQRLEEYERMWDGCGCKIDYYS